MRKLKHVISARQFTDPAAAAGLFLSARHMERDDRCARCLLHPLRGRILATLFYEPSTRTRFSFEAAMQKLGGGVLTAENVRESSSAAKGETIADTIRVVSGYADAIAIRHYEEGTPRKPRVFRRCPSSTPATVQASTRRRRSSTSTPSRKSLAASAACASRWWATCSTAARSTRCCRFWSLSAGVSFDLISPPQLRLPPKYLEMLKERTSPFTKAIISAAGSKRNVVYITRVQRERFASSRV